MHFPENFQLNNSHHFLYYAQHLSSNFEARSLIPCDNYFKETKMSSCVCEISHPTKIFPQVTWVPHLPWPQQFINLLDAMLGLIDCPMMPDNGLDFDVLNFYSVNTCHGSVPDYHHAIFETNCSVIVPNHPVLIPIQVVKNCMPSPNSFW